MNTSVDIGNPIYNKDINVKVINEKLIAETYLDNDEVLKVLVEINYFELNGFVDVTVKHMYLSAWLVSKATHLKEDIREAIVSHIGRPINTISWLN